MMQCFASLVFHPPCLGGRDVFALPPLGAAGEQDDKRLTVLSKVNSIAGSEIQFQFGNAAAEPLHMRAIAARKPRQRHRDPRLGLSVERIEPSLKRDTAVRSNERPDRDLNHLVSYMLPFGNTSLV